MNRSTIRRIAAACLVAGTLSAASQAVRAQAPAQPAPEAPLSALAPANLAKQRAAPPFNLTGNWFIDNSARIQGWLFGPAAIPKLDPALLARFPEGYRHLAYLQTRIGYEVKLDLPGLDGAAVEALYARGREWLDASRSTSPPM